MDQSSTIDCLIILCCVSGKKLKFESRNQGDNIKQISVYPSEKITYTW